MTYRNKEEYVYMDLQIRMSQKQMANVLYAGLQTDARFTTLYDMNRSQYTRTQNSYNLAWIKVHRHPQEIENFNTLSELKLKQPIHAHIN